MPLGAAKLLSVDDRGRSRPVLSYAPQVSGDGGVVVFASRGRMVRGVDRKGGVFLRDRAAGTVVIVDQSTDGVVKGEPASNYHLASGGGHVLLDSESRWLVDGDSGDTRDTFVRDVAAGTTSLINVAADGGFSEAESIGGAISPGGRFVAFASTGADLVEGVDPEGLGAFVRDLDTGITRIVSLTPEDEVADGDSIPHAVSDDGRWVVVRSTATDLVDGDEDDGIDDIFLLDTIIGTTYKLTTARDGGPADDDSGWGAAMDEGVNTVVFESDASNLVAGDTNEESDVFAFDLGSETVTLVSRARDGESASGYSRDIMISPDGRTVAYRAQRPRQHVKGIPYCNDNVVVRDLWSKKSWVAGLTRDGDCPRGPVLDPGIADGGYVVFSSVDRLDPKDQNLDTDVYGTRVF